MRFEFTLKSKTAMLMHEDDVEWSDEIDAWRLDPANAKKKGDKSGDDRRPAKTWLGYCYHDGEHIAVPSNNLRACLRIAGSRVPFKGTKTFKELAVSGLFFEDEFLTFFGNGKRIPIKPILPLHDEEKFAAHSKAIVASGFKLDVRRVKVGAGKHIRVRPRFETWFTTGVVEIVNDAITPQVLDDIFFQAGKCGLGDWRPASPKSPGVYGMFTHTLKKIK